MIHPLIHLKPRSYLECKTFSGLATLPSSTLRYTSIVLRHKPFHNLVLDPLYNDVAISRSHVDRSCVPDIDSDGVVLGIAGNEDNRISERLADIRSSCDL
jgi:hypothetical protein